MASNWRSHSLEKCTLAEMLIRELAVEETVPRQRALSEAAVLLLAEAECALWRFIAQSYGEKHAPVRSLSALTELLTVENGEVIRLREWSNTTGTWVQKLNVLRTQVCQIAEVKKSALSPSPTIIEVKEIDVVADADTLVSIAKGLRSYLGQITDLQGEC